MLVVKIRNVFTIDLHSTQKVTLLCLPVGLAAQLATRGKNIKRGPPSINILKSNNHHKIITSTSF